MKKPDYIKLSVKEITENGLIDQQGNFYSCQFNEHSQLYDKLREHGMDYKNWEEETAFVRVTNPGYMVLFQLMAKNITGKQKRVIEHYVEKFKVNISNVTISTYGGYRLYRDDSGKLQWEKPKR